MMSQRRCSQQRRIPGAPAGRALVASLLAAALAAAAPPQSAAAQQAQIQTVKLTPVPVGENVTVLRAVTSPDNRWLVYSRLESEHSSALWAVAVAGGEPVRLTDAGHWDDQPSFFPAGDRIIFTSTRPARAGDQHRYGMVLGFDPRTGRAVGQPRQITLDPLHFLPVPAVSPDGSQVVYVQFDTRRLKAVPAAGGQPRLLAEVPNQIHNLRWSEDGRTLYFSDRRGEDRALYRLPAEGGTPEAIFRTRKGLVAIGPDGRLVAISDQVQQMRDRTFEIVRVADGAVLARHAGTLNDQVNTFSADGRRLVGTTTLVTAPIRIVPVTGGEPRTVTSAANYDWPAGWTRDGAAVFAFSISDDGPVMLEAPRAGGGVRAHGVFRELAETRWWQAAGDHLYQVSRRADADEWRLTRVDRHTGARALVSERVLVAPQRPVIGPGGLYSTLPDGVLYLERSASGGLDLYAARGEQPPRLLRAFALDELLRSGLAVHGERIAFFRVEGDSSHLMIVDGPRGTPRRLASFGVRPTSTSTHAAAFSHDGRWIATYSDAGDDGNAVVLELTPEGELASPPRRIPSGGTYWYEPMWLQDNSGFTAIVGYGHGLGTHVVRLSLAAGVEPLVITRSDPAPKWGHTLSPDGRFVAYPGEIYSGGAPWIMDLSALAGHR
jgi:Tol biopolymer transport system component